MTTPNRQLLTCLMHTPVDVIPPFMNHSWWFMSAYHIDLTGKATVWAICKQKLILKNQLLGIKALGSNLHISAIKIDGCAGSPHHNHQNCCLCLSATVLAQTDFSVAPLTHDQGSPRISETMQDGFFL